MHLTVVFISNVGDMRKDEDLLSQSPKTYGDRVFSFPHMPVDHHARGFSSNANASQTKQATHDY